MENEKNIRMKHKNSFRLKPTTSIIDVFPGFQQSQEVELFKTDKKKLENQITLGEKFYVV